MIDVLRCQVDNRIDPFDCTPQTRFVAHVAGDNLDVLTMAGLNVADEDPQWRSRWVVAAALQDVSPDEAIGAGHENHGFAPLRRFTPREVTLMKRRSVSVAASPLGSISRPTTSRAGPV